MNRIRLVCGIALALTCALVSFVQAAAPPAVPFGGDRPSLTRVVVPEATRVLPGGSVTLGYYSDPVVAAKAIGDRLADLQSDVTEDNAGNGSPDLPADGDDGGWDWVVTGQAHHVGNGSYENLYGPIARGLVEAAIMTGDARLAIASGDVFAGISRTGVGLLGSPYFRIFDGDIATPYVRWADHTGNAALEDTIRARHDTELVVRGGAGGRARTICFGRRGQGLPGLWPWDVHLLANDSKVLAAAFPGSAATYEAEVDSISQVLMDDMNGLLGAGGWNPVDFGQNYHQTGLAGALRVFDASQRTDDDALATAMRDSLVNGQLPDGSWGVSYGGSFYADDAQATAYAVLALMEYSQRHGDGTARHAAMLGQQGLLGLVQAGGVVDDGGGEYAETAGEVVQALLTGDEVSPVGPPTCITPAHACVQVPVVFNRVDPTGVRGYSVTLTLSANLSVCGAGIVEGTYLTSVGSTNYQVLSLGGGVYTVDCAILGAPCGATGSGTLFTLNLASVIPSGIGTVTINSVTVRDCNNAPVGAIPGPPASITIDNTAPVAIADLAAAQVKTGNDGDGTTRITLTFTPPGDAAVIEVYRAGFGNYPEYDDAPGAGSVPAIPSYPPAAPWALTAVTASGQTDEVATRDFWYFVAFTQDACGNISPVSNRTSGTLNYHLGDIAAGCVGNNLVATPDVSFLGAHYGIALGLSDPLGCLDVGPTTDYSVNARPTTDNRVQFEDLMMFAINYGQVSLVEQLAAAVADRDELWLEAPQQVEAGEMVTATLRLQGAGDLQGLSAQLSWDAAVVEPLAVAAGALVASQQGVALSPRPGAVDVALLGSRRKGLVGEGALATVTFRALRAGDPRLVLAQVEARDLANQPVVPGVIGVREVVERTEFLAPMPNPFHDQSVLAFSLARPGPVELAIYAVDGRRVRTLLHETREAGMYRLVWDGRDGRGQVARPGMYFARLVTAEGRFARTLLRVR